MRSSETANEGWFRAGWPGPATAICTTRRFTAAQGGASRGAYAVFNLAAHVGDRDEAVRENRRRLRERLRLDHIQWLAQVHGTTVLADVCEAAPAAEADASWTRTLGVGVAVLTADCLPVAVTDGEGSVAGVAHAGWRGLAAGVIESLVASLPVAAASLRAWIGPGISARHYEVGAEVRAAFLDRAAADADCFELTRPGHWRADLVGLARARLRRLGVAGVTGGDVCTFADGRCYSHRRSAPTGRMATVVYRT